VTFLPEAAGHSAPNFAAGRFWNIRLGAPPPFVGGRDGSSAFWDCSCRGAQRAVGRNVLQRSIGPRAGNLLAGAGALRDAAGLPKALRGLHGNWLLDCNAGAKVRIRKAIRKTLAAPEAAASFWASQNYRRGAGNPLGEAADRGGLAGPLPEVLRRHDNHGSEHNHE